MDTSVMMPFTSENPHNTSRRMYSIDTLSRLVENRFSRFLEGYWLELDDPVSYNISHLAVSIIFFCSIVVSLGLLKAKTFKPNVGIFSLLRP